MEGFIDYYNSREEYGYIRGADRKAYVFRKDSTNWSGLKYIPYRQILKHKVTFEPQTLAGHTRARAHNVKILNERIKRHDRNSRTLQQ